MIAQKFNKWREAQNIHIEEDFASAFDNYAREYKKKRNEKHEGYLCPFRRQLADCI